MSKVAVVIPAAGQGTRARRDGQKSKQFEPIGGRSALERVVERFRCNPSVTLIVVAAPADDVNALRGLLPQSGVKVVAGGDSRQGSIRIALSSINAESHDRVLVHDAARPFVDDALINRAIVALDAHEAAVPVTRIADTVIEAGASGLRGETLDRDKLRAVQTPQAFRTSALISAHIAATEAGRDDFTDDGALMAWHGHEVALFDGDPRNTKLTTTQDMDAAKRHFSEKDYLACPDVRLGNGFDVHAFAEGDHVVLGGITIPHERSLSGHSDADVVLHALTDAILGALADGDIGAHFPPSDQRWKGQDSSLFLLDAVARVKARGGFIAHLDATIMCEAPKIGPHRDAMRARIAELCGLPVGRVAVKATTTEKLGFTGRREGIATMATATIRLPLSSEAFQ